MKKARKLLIGTALAGGLIAVAGYGTYSWFTAESNVTGNIQTHILKLEPSSVTLFEDSTKKLAPGRSIADSFTVRNTGDMDQSLRGQFQLSADKAVDYSKYKIKLNVSYNGADGSVHNGRLEGNGSQAVNLMEKWLPNNNGSKGSFVFKPGDALTFDVEVSLDPKAGNEYQGVTLNGKAAIQGAQTDDGAEF